MGKNKKYRILHTISSLCHFSITKHIKIRRGQSLNFKMPAMDIETLNELSQLCRSHFGRPEPRHGLRLLYWFADEFIEFVSNQMVATERPDTAAFGFHPFHNRPDHDGDTLLPETENSDYYEVGNLKKTNAYQFPDYVTEEYTGGRDNSNSDRIIVDMDGRNVYRVYVTHHVGRSNFSRSETYRISQGLIRIISRMTLEDFLSEMEPPRQAAVLQADVQVVNLHRDESSWRNCIIL